MSDKSSHSDSEEISGTVSSSSISISGSVSSSSLSGSESYSKKQEKTETKVEKKEETKVETKEEKKVEKVEKKEETEERKVIIVDQENTEEKKERIPALKPRFEEPPSSSEKYSDSDEERLHQVQKRRKSESILDPSKIQIIPHQESCGCELVKYHFIYDPRHSIKGTRFHFQMDKESEHLFHAKCKSNKAHEIFIAEGDDCHISGNHFAVIKTDEKLNEFKLFCENDSDAQFTTKFTRKIKNSPRVCYFNATKATDAPKDLISKRPKITGVGAWKIDFGEYKFEKSPGNSILVQPDDNKQYIVFGNTGGKEFDLLAHPGYRPIDVFAFAISSLLTAP